jgi:hypothetical protein
MASAVPDIVFVGPVTWDLFEGGRRPGGAVTFAALVATSMGARAGIVTTAGTDADLAALEGHEVRVIPSAATLTFEHRLDERGRRELRVVERAVPVSARPERVEGRAEEALAAVDIPEAWRGARDIVLAPLLAEDIDVRSFLGGPGRVWILAQGLMRYLSGDGTVQEIEEPMPALDPVFGLPCSLFLSEVEAARWSPADFSAVVAGVDELVVTRGAEGATIYRGDAQWEVAACPAEAVDTTGAGDTFAAAFILASSRLGLDDLEAARLASAYAAAGVERVGQVPLPPLSAMERRAAIAAGGAGA